MSTETDQQPDKLDAQKDQPVHIPPQQPDPSPPGSPFSLSDLLQRQNFEFFIGNETFQTSVLILKAVKRRWRCGEQDCDAKTWTETHPGFSSRTLLTRRAGIEATVAVGRDAAPVALLARRFGVGWNTIHCVVEEYGTALVEDPNRVGDVEQLGVDETSFRAAKPTRRTGYVTAMVDLKHQRC